MQKQTKYFAKYFNSGTIVANESDVEIDRPSPDLLKFPNGAFKAVIFEAKSIIDDGIVYKAARSQIGPDYYPRDAVLMTLAEVEADPSCTDILAQNMRLNRWDKIIMSRNWSTPATGAFEILQRN